MTDANDPGRSRNRRRGRGEGGISYDRTNKAYIATVSLGHAPDGSRIRRTVRGRTKTQAKDRLQEVRDEIKAGVRTSATYTVEDCVKDWLASLERDPHTLETIIGQARKWIYPRIGAKKLRRFKVDDADKFFREIAPFLSKRSLVMIKSTLRRSIRRAQARDLIGRNVIDLIDLPPGRPGRPSRAMTEEQAAAVLKAARGRLDRYTGVVKASNGRYGATHAATESRHARLRHPAAPEGDITEVGRDLQQATCRACRTQLGLDSDGDANQRLAALFVVAITLGLRPGELRKLTWDLVDLNQGVVHVWRSASKSGDTKTPSPSAPSSSPSAPSARSPPTSSCKTANARPRPELARNQLVFCHEDGSMYSADALNWRFGKMTGKAGIGHWHAHEDATPPSRS